MLTVVVGEGRAQLGHTWGGGWGWDAISFPEDVWVGCKWRPRRLRRLPQRTYALN